MTHDFKPIPPLGQLSQVFDHVPFSMAVFDHDMRYVMANRLWLTEFQLEKVAYVGKSQYELFPNLHHGWRDLYESALKGQVVRSQKEAARGDGKVARHSWEFRPWLTEMGSVGGLIVTCSQELRETEAEPEATREDAGLWMSPQPIMGLNRSGVILKASFGALEFLLPHGLLLGKAKFSELWADSDTPLKVHQQLDLVRRGQRAELLKLEVKGKSEANYWSLCQVQNLGEEDHDTLAFLAIAVPVAPTVAAAPVPSSVDKIDQAHVTKLRSELREALESDQLSRQREARLRNVLDLAPSGILILDERSRPIYQNEQLKKLVGRELTETQTVEDWLQEGIRADEDRELLIRGWRERVWRRQVETVMRLYNTKNEQLRDLQMRPVSLPGGGMMLMVTDVTEYRRTEETLLLIESRFRTVMHDNPQPVVLTDGDGLVFEMNAAAEDYLQSARAKSRGTSLSRWWDEASEARYRQLLSEALSSDKAPEAVSMELKSEREGYGRHLELKVAPIVDSIGSIHSFIHFLTPKRQEVAKPVVAPPLVAIESLPETSFEDFLLDPEPVVEKVMEREWVDQPLLGTDAQGKVITWSEEATAIFGYSPDLMVGQGLNRLFRPSDPTGFNMDLIFLLRGELPMELEWFYFHPSEGKKQSTFTLRSNLGQGASVQLWKRVEVVREREIEVRPVVEPVFASITDTWVPEAPKRFEPMAPIVSVAEEDVEREKLLLKDSHTRIQNNLHVLSSMLTLQMSTLRNEEALEALRSSQNRVRSMALVHKLLADIADGAGLSFRRFVDELVIHLRESYEVGGDRVTVSLELQEDSVRDEWLTPLAFSLNEMISNVFQHAFAREEIGQVAIRLTWNDEVGMLAVSDTGRGLLSTAPEDIPSSAMGMKILRVFAGQLGGEVRTVPLQPQGVDFQLHFPVATKSGTAKITSDPLA